MEELVGLYAMIAHDGRLRPLRYRLDAPQVRGKRVLRAEAARLTVELTRRYYELGEDAVLPRAIAGTQAFENAMSLDIAMGSGRETLKALRLAGAIGLLDEGTVAREVDDIDRIVATLYKVARRPPR